MSAAKVFISHHIKKDERLASSLKLILEKRGIDGYVAQFAPEYDLLISDKIKNKINSADYLAAIITEHGLSSASVHEEIGYAMGKDIPVILMVEEEVKQSGVLIYGKEPYLFTRKFFDVEADEIAKFIQKKKVPRRKTSSRLSKAKEPNEYQKYGLTEKLQHLRLDTIAAFAHFGFVHCPIVIRMNKERFGMPQSLNLDMVEDQKRKQRFFLFVLATSVDEDALDRIYNTIRSYIFPSLNDSKYWLNLCAIITSESVSKKLVESYYFKIHSNQGFTSQNTTIGYDSLIYYGLGSRAHLKLQDTKDWQFHSSIPRFFLSRVSSRRDLQLKVGSIEGFIDDHQDIFCNVIRLKTLYKQHETPMMKENRSARLFRK